MQGIQQRLDAARCVLEPLSDTPQRAVISGLQSKAALALMKAAQPLSDEQRAVCVDLVCQTKFHGDDGHKLLVYLAESQEAEVARQEAEVARAPPVLAIRGRRGSQDFMSFMSFLDEATWNSLLGGTTPQTAFAILATFLCTFFGLRLPNENSSKLCASFSQVVSANGSRDLNGISILDRHAFHDWVKADFRRRCRAMERPEEYITTLPQTPELLRASFPVVYGRAYTHGDPIKPELANEVMAFDLSYTCRGGGANSHKFDRSPGFGSPTTLQLGTDNSLGQVSTVANAMMQSIGALAANQQRMMDMWCPNLSGGGGGGGGGFVGEGLQRLLDKSARPTGGQPALLDRMDRRRVHFERDPTHPPLPPPASQQPLPPTGSTTLAPDGERQSALRKWPTQLALCQLPADPLTPSPPTAESSAPLEPSGAIPQAPGETKASVPLPPAAELGGVVPAAGDALSRINGFMAALESRSKDDNNKAKVKKKAKEGKAEKGKPGDALRAYLARIRGAKAAEKAAAAAPPAKEAKKVGRPPKPPAKRRRRLCKKTPDYA